MSASEKKALEQLEKLHEEIQELNSTQRVALTSIDTLSSTVFDISTQIEKVFPQTHRRQYYSTFQEGYIDWYASKQIQNQHWKKISEFIEFCGAIERFEYFEGKRPDMNEKVIVNEKTRFPCDILVETEDEVYINAKSTSVLTVMLYIDEILKHDNKESRRGLLKHFLDFVKNDAHTRISFEEKYSLTWRDRRTYY